MPSNDLSLIALTDLGWQQARDVAASWDKTPSLIVTSPYLRTQQTAAPTIERFPEAPVEVWPIEEFTYLQPARWNGTASAVRMPHLERYWRDADPEYCDGDEAESFANLMNRATTCLNRLASLQNNERVYLFSHGQFIQAVRSLITQSNLELRDIMRGFWRKGAAPAISNAEIVPFVLVEKSWQVAPDFIN